MISVQNLTKKYPTTTALNDVSFEVKQGEVLGFLGPNGAGKTTTMKIITGFIAPTQGTVKLGNLDIHTDSLEIRKRIGYLPESVPLYNDMSVLEYLKFIGEIRQHSQASTLSQPISKSDFYERLKQVTQVCGLMKMANRQISELSKGYRQRTALAQALIHNPEVLILDEPTSGLDPNQIVEIRELIRRIGQEKTVILSTHILQEVSAVCSRVIIINEGKIAVSGTVEELEAQAQGQETVYVKIKGVQEAVRQALLDLDHILEVKHKDKEGDSAFGFDLRINPGADVREMIFNLASSRSWPILEMRREKASLEDVFRRLTS